MTDKYADLRAALDDGWVQSIHPDTVRALLAERDALSNRLEGAANYIDKLGGNSKPLRAALAQEGP